MSGKMIEKMALSQKTEHHIDQKVRSPKIENRTEKSRSHLTNFQDSIFTWYVLAIISVLQLFRTILLLTTL